MAEINSRFWLLTFDCFKNDVKKPEDNLIILVHWLLLNNDFQVLGLGHENEIDENEKPIDSLPENWSDKITFKLRYVRDKSLFLLSGVKAGDSFIFNFYDVTTTYVSSAAFGDINTIVQCISDIEKNKEKFNETVNMLQIDLINPMQKENDTKKVASTQTVEIGFPDLICCKDPIDPRFGSGSYGNADLDPLAGLHNPDAGMIFDPLSIMCPLTARFDPIHPPNPDLAVIPGTLGRLNPDHMIPPDFDDMFM